MNKKGAGALVFGLIALAVIVAGYFILFPSVSAGTGILKLQITDAPSEFNISKALVTLSSIEVHMALGNGNNETNETNFTSGWIVVVPGPVSYDLIEIIDVKDFLGSKELNVGKYTQIRLNVESAKVTIDGTEYNLTIPSGKIKLIHPFTIEENKTTALTLDFDANESIRSAGESNKYILQPVIRVITE
ncbi:MAG: DUF4382 domain-containing protein [archaeon]|nr:DUF4382 domain-containing protein [archaeon]